MTLKVTDNQYGQLSLRQLGFFLKRRAISLLRLFALSCETEIGFPASPKLLFFLYARLGCSVTDIKIYVKKTFTTVCKDDVMISVL